MQNATQAPPTPDPLAISSRPPGHCVATAHGPPATDPRLDRRLYRGQCHAADARGDRGGPRVFNAEFSRGPSACSGEEGSAGASPRIIAGPAAATHAGCPGAGNAATRGARRGGEPNPCGRERRGSLPDRCATFLAERGLSVAGTRLEHEGRRHPRRRSPRGAQRSGGAARTDRSGSRRRGREIVLLPENSEFEPIVVDPRETAFAIEGIAVGLVRT